MKLGLIDVGGGLRDIYGAGVLDMCMDSGVRFDYCIGVSAGSANITSYLSGQRRRNFKFYYEYSFRREYMGFGNYIKKGSFFDLGYVYGTLSRSDGENPLDFETMKNNPAEFVIVTSEAESGRVRYFTKDDLEPDRYDPLMASCAIPVVCEPYEINGVKYFDGALTDPVPVKKALADGCDKLVLILTKPRETKRSSIKDDSLARILHHAYPISAHNLHLRAKRYNDAVEYAKQLEKEGRLLIVAPDDISGVDTTKRSKEALLRLYCKGYADGGAILPFVSK